MGCNHEPLKTELHRRHDAATQVGSDARSLLPQTHTPPTLSCLRTHCVAILVGGMPDLLLLLLLYLVGGVQRDVAILEEPEHLNWFQHSSRWNRAFNHVVGIM